MATLAAPETALASLDFASLLLAIQRTLRAWLTTPDETAAARSLVDFAVHDVGARLLAARNEDDLDDRLDDLLAERKLYHLNALLLGALDVRALEAMSVERATGAMEQALADALDPTALARLKEAGPMVAGWLRAQVEALRIDPEGAQRNADKLGPQTLWSPDLPPEIALAIGGALKASACTLALALAGERKGVAAWLGAALVDRFLAGVRAHLRLLAVVPGVHVAESVLPVGERLDLAVLMERFVKSRVVAAHLGRTDR